jgi:hypothetical protein
VEAGYRDFSFGSSGSTAPTGDKPESKLWWNDGWWGSLYNDALQEHHIYRLDLVSQTWIDTGTQLDPRPRSKADTLWDGQRLYVVSKLFSTSAGPRPCPAECGQLFRYSYNVATETYSLAPGFPVVVSGGRSEALTLAKGVGHLWVSYVESSTVMVNNSTITDTLWAGPMTLPVDTLAVSVSSDDISSTVAFGNRIGVMWTNQLTRKLYFAHRDDSSSSSSWSLEEVPLPGTGSTLGPDDHLSLRVDSMNRVYAVVKLQTPPNASDPLNVVVRRDSSGAWSSSVFGRKTDDHTRAILLIDEPNQRVRVFATSPESGGAIYTKSASLDTLQFPQGLGQPFIQSSSDTSTNNATSTKQNITAATGLAVLAGDSVTRFYLHNYTPIDAGTPAASHTPPATATPASPTVTPAVNTSTPSSTATPTSTAAPATSTPTVQPSDTATATRPPLGTATPTQPPASPTTAPTSGAPASPSPTSQLSARIKDMTFEDRRLVDAMSGADAIVGKLGIESASPLKGLYSALVPNTGSSYLIEEFEPAHDLFVSMYVTVKQTPRSNVQLLEVRSGADTLGNLVVTPSGSLRVRLGARQVGRDWPKLTPGALLRLGLHQGTGAASGGAPLLEAFVARNDDQFGPPFAFSDSVGLVTAATSVRVGATTMGGIHVVVDDVRLDRAAMPGPSQR